ncbi:recombinase family protein [Desulfosporosinus sp. OT]|uniref:recombinase family protein n=1 Tax=Desulfosporosinus sp. OT TaxID=913865 RepID=UPI0032B86CC4
MQMTIWGFAKSPTTLTYKVKKIKRDNGTLSQWSTHFVRMIIDNPVYCGKISYGRRVREKVKGTKNEYRQAPQENYILADGQHEAIICEELGIKHIKKEK